jgi:hypothetical protein
MKVEVPIAHLSNLALLEETERLADNARRATARLIAALAEVDLRKLWADEGCSSLFAYCTRVLHFSEQEAYLRIEAARVAERFPVALEMLDAGELTLTNVGLLKPHLTAENHAALLDAARGKSKKEVARQVAGLRDDSGSVSEFTASIIPVAADRFRLTVEIADETYDNLQHVTDLLRHAVPDGDVAQVLDRALASLLRDLERTKWAATNAPREPREVASTSRHIPASVKRAVRQRDDGRCAFVGGQGRCNATAFLEFHHINPFALGGRSTIDNIELRCRAHNQREAELFFGEAMPGVVREQMAVYGELGPDLVSLPPRATGRTPPNGRSTAASSFGYSRCRRADAWHRVKQSPRYRGPQSLPSVRRWRAGFDVGRLRLVSKT